MHQVEFALERGKPTFMWRPAEADAGIKRGLEKYVSLGAEPFDTVDCSSI